MNISTLQITTPLLSYEQVMVNWQISTDIQSTATLTEIINKLCQMNKKQGKEVALFRDDFGTPKVFLTGPKDDKGNLLKLTQVKF